MNRQDVIDDFNRAEITIRIPSGDLPEELGSFQTDSIRVHVTADEPSPFFDPFHGVVMFIIVQILSKTEDDFDVLTDYLTTAFQEELIFLKVTDGRGAVFTQTPFVGRGDTCFLAVLPPGEYHLELI